MVRLSVKQKVNGLIINKHYEQKNSLWLADKGGHGKLSV